MAEQNLLPEEVLPEIYAERARAVTKRYHVGMVPNGPAWNQTFAGISFPITTSTFDENDNEFKRDGAIVELTAAQCKAIREAIRNRVVRWNHYPKGHKRAGEKSAAQIYDVRCRGFEPETGDEPLVTYVYFREAPAEFVQPAAPASAFDALDRAIKSAEVSEQKAAVDPEDAKVRAKHGQAKTLGRTLGEAPGAL